MSAETMNESEIVYRDPETFVFKHVTTPVPLLKYKDGKTCVFWDVEDYPIPDGHDPLWMKDQIEQALNKKGYIVGLSSIQAYVNEDTYSHELAKKYSDANIKLCTLSEGNKYVKMGSMIVDVFLWANDNKYQSNLIVLSKKLGKDACSMAEGLFYSGYCILLSTTQPDWWDGPSEAETCFLTSLFDGGAAASNMETLFPKSDRMSCVGRDTRIFFDMNSFDTIPKEPYKITQHIRSLLMKEGYGGFVSFEVMFVDDNTFPDYDLKIKYQEADFFIPLIGQVFDIELKGGEKAAAYDFILTSILYWALNKKPSNLLVISDNPNFGQGKFAAIRESLEKKDFKVAVTQLESVMNLSAL